MFGFGDSIEPHPQTVELMDQLVKDFMTNLVEVASSHSSVVSTVFRHRKEDASKYGQRNDPVRRKVQGVHFLQVTNSLETISTV